MSKANGTGGCYGRRLSGLPKFIPFKMGLQIPCGVYTPPKKKRKALFGSTAFEAAQLIKPPPLRGVSDFLFQKFEEIL
jgi:hypothetical protein